MKAMKSFRNRRLMTAIIGMIWLFPSYAMQIYQDYDIFTEETEDGIPLKYMIYTEVNEEEAGMDEFGHIYKRDTTVTCHLMNDQSYRYGAVGRLKIPESVHGQPVTYIDEKAFEGCSMITEVVIPNTVKNLSNMVFYGCRGIVALTLPEGLETIGVSTFEGCKKIETVTFPSTLRKIGQCAFYGCSGLRDLVNLDFSVEFGVKPFGGCPLTDFDYSTVRGTFPPVFAGNEGITSIMLPEGVTALSSNAFMGCSGLKSITLPTTLTRVGFAAFSGCASLEQVNGLDLSVTSLENHVFYGCTSLKYADFSGISGSICDYVFYGWDGLECASLPEGVTSIGKETFKNCSCLSRIDLPSTLAVMENETFAGCTNLKDVYLYAAAPPMIPDDCFSPETKAVCTLHVCAGMRQLFEVAPGWDFASIVEMDEEQGIGAVVNGDSGVAKEKYVYDLLGLKIANGNSVRGLAKGLYISDGKKYVR